MVRSTDLLSTYVMSQEPEAPFAKRLLTFLVTVVPWLFGGTSIYEIVRLISCARLLTADGSSYNIWCIYISYDFRPDVMFLTLILVVLAFIFPVLILGQKPRLVIYSTIVISISIICIVGRIAIQNSIASTDKF
jgi:hypothetical protein